MKEYSFVTVSIIYILFTLPYCKAERWGFFHEVVFPTLYIQFSVSPDIWVFQRGIITEEPDYNVSENEVAALQQRALF